MFSDESINIHYRAPTSKLLLKMNTFNEFELNRIKKFYHDELANRVLLRSKSSRLSDGAPRRVAPSVGDGDRSSGASSSLSLSPPRRERSRQAAGSFHLAARRNGPPSQPAPASPTAGVDLNRYQRAFLTKRAAAATTGSSCSTRGAAGGGSNLEQLRKSVARFGRTLFDFQAKNERELSLKRGDLVEMLELVDHNWARVEDCQSGLTGLVPLSYIDYSVGCAVARRDVSGQQQVSRSCAQEAPLLAMSKGEPITLIRRLSGHWYEASNTRQASGLVWSNDLDIIKQPVLVASSAGATNLPARFVSSPRRNGDDFAGNNNDSEEEQEEEDEDEEMLFLDTGERVLASRRRPKSAAATRPAAACECRACACAPATSGPASNQQQQQQSNYCCQQQADGFRTLQSCSGQPMMRQPRRSSSSPYISVAAGQRQQSVPRLCRAKFAYKPRQSDELELVVGDVLMVVHECDDGWFMGTSYSTRASGTFPGNFVEPIASG